MRISFGLNDLPVVLQAHADLYGWRHTLRRVPKVVHDLLRQRYRVARQDRGPRRRGKALLVFHFRTQPGILAGQAVSVGIVRFVWPHPQLDDRSESECRLTEWTFDEGSEPLGRPIIYEDGAEYVADVLRAVEDEARAQGCLVFSAFVPEVLCLDILREGRVQGRRWFIGERTKVDELGKLYIEIGHFPR